MRRFFISIIGALAVFSAGAAGETVPTTKSYVDSALTQKQDTIERTTGASQVLTNTGTEGEVGTKEIYDSAGAYIGQSDALIDAQTMNTGVQNAIDSEFQCISWVDDDPTKDCLLMDVRGTPPKRSPNLFDISKITTNDRIINNGDGSITLIGTSMTHPSNEKLSTLAPDLEVGKSYVLSLTTTHQKTIYVNVPARVYWHNGEVKTITQDMLDGGVIFYTNPGETGLISNIQIEESTTVTPYQPYGNIYIPSGN